MYCRQHLALIVPITLAVVLLASCGAAPVPVVAPDAPAVAATVAVAATPTTAPTEVATSAPRTTATTMPEASSPSAAQPAASVDSFTLEIPALQGNLLGDPSSRVVQVLLPPGYATSNQRYPVVYYLHGYQGPLSLPMLDRQQELFSMQYRGTPGATGDLIADADRAMKNGDLQEMILVFPNASNLLGGSFYRSSLTIGDYESYLTKDLVDFVDGHYRTLARRASRGLTGCSMGGEGTIHLALRYPHVYSVAVAQSGPYFLEREPLFVDTPTSPYALALAAAVAPNPDKPPLYLDMPWVLKDGFKTLAPGFVEKIKADSTAADVEAYLAQPERLNALLLQHSRNEQTISFALEFDKLLTEKGIPHDLDASFLNHCSYDEFPPMLKFMSDHLAGQSPLSVSGTAQSADRGRAI